jgi:hypothetical protein
MENEEGVIVREFMRECDTIVLHRNMKEVLVYLTNLDVKEMEKIMTRKLAKQVFTNHKSCKGPHRSKHVLIFFIKFFFFQILLDGWLRIFMDKS